MKRFLISAAVAAALAGCSPQPGVTLSITGLEAEDSVMVVRSTLVNNTSRITDTLAAPYGSLFIPTTSDEAMVYSIYKLPRRFPDGSMEAISMHSIYVTVLPDAAINVVGDFNEYKVTGNTAFYKEFEAMEKMIVPLRIEAFNAAKASYDRTRPKSERDSLGAVVNDYETRISTIVNDYVANNNDSDVALYAFYHYANVENDYETLDKLTERVRKGIFAPYYDALVERYESYKKRIEAEKKVADGMIAPDFTLKSIDGSSVALSSLRGKYVVIDFWGSWCGWCIKGIPEMKQMYKKYSKQLEIVGIACGDTEEVWKKCVAENELPWLNLLNGSGENSVPDKYAVKGYPTKIILDKEGRILKTVLGESPQFYKFIDSLMKK